MPFYLGLAQISQIFFVCISLWIWRLRVSKKNWRIITYIYTIFFMPISAFISPFLGIAQIPKYFMCWRPWNLRFGALKMVLKIYENLCIQFRNQYHSHHSFHAYFCIYMSSFRNCVNFYKFSCVLAINLTSGAPKKFYSQSIYRNLRIELGNHQMYSYQFFTLIYASIVLLSITQISHSQALSQNHASFSIFHAKQRRDLESGAPIFLKKHYEVLHIELENHK